MKGQKCLDLAKMIIIARASEVPVPSEGLSVSLMHFPSLFLKHIIKGVAQFCICSTNNVSEKACSSQEA